MNEQVDILEHELITFMNGEEQRDDITVIGLKLHHFKTE
jgi:serine phosphatase RsbU (regulator of sigma subunit)